jgi:ribosomal protein L29
MIEKKSNKTDLTKIRAEVIDLKKALMNLKFQKSTGQLEKTSEIKKTKLKIARLKTNITKILGVQNA